MNRRSEFRDGLGGPLFWLTGTWRLYRLLAFVQDGGSG